MARDDGMDEHGIGWLYGCHLLILAQQLGKSHLIYVTPQPQI
jgi:hypothetical protein